MQYEPIKGTTVIGIGHKARQGKDTLATEIMKLIPGQAQRYSFANDLKAVARVLGMRKKDGPLLQALGTDVFRRLDEDIWVRCLYDHIKEEAPKVAIIPDVRFPNEAEMVHAIGGTLVRVTRWNPDGTQYISTDRDPNHPSETALDKLVFDYGIEALDGEMDKLAQQAKYLVSALGL